MLELFRRIRNRREELGISQDELAKRVGYKSRSSINKIELGKNDITQSKIVEIASALDTTPEYLMGWQVEMSKRVNDEESKLVDEYRLLNEEGKQLVRGMIYQLSKTKALTANVDNHNITQNNKNGNNYYGITSGNFNSNVTVK